MGYFLFTTSLFRFFSHLYGTFFRVSLIFLEEGSVSFYCFGSFTFIRLSLFLEDISLVLRPQLYRLSCGMEFFWRHAFTFRLCFSFILGFRFIYQLGSRKGLRCKYFRLKGPQTATLKSIQAKSWSYYWEISNTCQWSNVMNSYPFKTIFP